MAPNRNSRAVDTQRRHTVCVLFLRRTHPLSCCRATQLWRCARPRAWEPKRRCSRARAAQVLVFPLLRPVAHKLAPMLVLLRMALVASSGRATVARDAHLLPLIRAGLRGCFARTRRHAWRLLTCPFFCPAGCGVPGCLPGDRGHCPSRAGPGAGGADDAHDRRNQPLSISSASWVVRATWAKGYVVDVTVIVDCLDSSRKHRFGVDGFRVHFTLGDGALIAKTWNAKFVQKGAACEATHERFCAPVHSEQAVLYFGFEVRIDMAAASTPFIPAAITVNGQLCPVRGCFARDLADCRNDDDESDDFPAPPRSATRKDKEPVGLEENQETVARTRCCSAPPVLYTESFGVASLPSQGEDAIAPLASASHSPKNSDEWHVDSWNDDGKSVAETVHERAPSRGGVCDDWPRASEVRDSCGEAVPTPPHDSRASVLASASTVATSRKRKFEENDTEKKSAHHTRGVCSESRAIPQPSHDDIETSPLRSPLRYPKTLQVDYYRRSEALKKRKYLHMDYLDMHFRSREQVILSSVLDDSSRPVVLEPNMFPYDTPAGVSHWTLWSRQWLEEEEVESFVDGWLGENMPDAIEWGHDDNMADGLSINLFHLHIYIRCPGTP